MSHSFPLFAREEYHRNIAETRIVAMLALRGWAYEDFDFAHWAAGDLLAAYVKMGLEFRTSPEGERLFDPVEVDNFAKKARDNSDDSFGEWVVQANRRLVNDLAVDGSTEKRFFIEFRRTFNLQSIAAGTSLRLRAPLPLEGPFLRDLEAKPFAENVHDPKFSVSPGHVDLRMTATGQAEVTLGARLSFTSRLQQPNPDQAPHDEDTKLYLSAREGLIVVNKRMRKLAWSLAGDTATDLEAVRSFWDYIKGEVSNGAVKYDRVDPASPCDIVLDAGWYDCQMGAVSLVTLCRAHGLPARILSGYLLHPIFPGLHYWSEVWITGQGWTPFDLFNLRSRNDGNDRKWHDLFFGRLEHRMTCERLPREFVGLPGVPMPSSCFFVQERTPDDITNSVVGIDGTTVYSDSLRFPA